MCIQHDFRLAFRRNSKEAALTNRMLRDLIVSFTMPSNTQRFHFMFIQYVSKGRCSIIVGRLHNSLSHNFCLVGVVRNENDLLEYFWGEGTTNAMDVPKLIRFFLFFLWKFTRHATVNIVWINFVFSEAFSSHVCHYLSHRDGAWGWIQL